jgi:hypothetical protein
MRRDTIVEQEEQTNGLLEAEEDVMSFDAIFIIVLITWQEIERNTQRMS